MGIDKKDGPARTQKQLWLGVILVLCLYPSAVSGFTGNDWQRSSTDGKVMYLVGILDGWEFAEGVHNVRKHSDDPSLIHCWDKNMTYGQFLAMVEKYMTEHPQNWHEIMPIIVLRTLNQICKNR